MDCVVLPRTAAEPGGHLPYNPSEFGYEWFHGEDPGTYVATTRDGLTDLILSPTDYGAVEWSAVDDEGVVERGNFSGIYDDPSALDGLLYRGDRLLAEFDTNGVMPPKDFSYNKDYTEDFPNSFPAPDFREPGIYAANLPGLRITQEAPNKVVAWDDLTDDPWTRRMGVGMLSWDDAGVITWVQVYEDEYQRLGIGSAMLEWARANVRPDITHSTELSDSGVGWAQATGSVRVGFPKTQKCEYCDQQATQRIIHSEGMAFIPTCDTHLQQGKDDAAACVPYGGSDPSNIDRVEKVGAGRYSSGLGKARLGQVWHGLAGLGLAGPGRAWHGIDGDRTDVIGSVAALQPGPESNHDGVAVVLGLLEEDRDALAIEGGEPPDDLHITLAFLGDARNFINGPNALLDICAEIAATTFPFVVNLNGITRFCGEETDPLVVNADSPHIDPLHHRLIETMQAAGFSTASGHGFTPHMTLGYLQPDDDLPMDRWEPVEVNISTLELWFGGERFAYEFARPESSERAAAHLAAVNPMDENIAADSGYFYHATSDWNLGDIEDSGVLSVHDPDYGTEQGAWPDASNDPRSYWTHDPAIARSFYPEDGDPVLLRAPRGAADFRRESTGDYYLTSDLPASRLEQYVGDGQWTPLR